MNFLSIIIVSIKIYIVTSSECNIKCPKGEDKPVCGLDFRNLAYKMFRSDCAMAAYTQCYHKDFIPVSLSSCIKSQVSRARRVYMESCPAFCPQYYRPVCAASTLREYQYRTFENGCYLDMINCRGHEDSGYVEVPLKYCQNHLMKNFFREQIVSCKVDCANSNLVLKAFQSLVHDGSATLHRFPASSNSGLGNRFGDEQGTTQRLPLEALGDRNLVNRLSRLPVDKQPFWFINWRAYEENRMRPQTYEQRPNVFVDPIPSNQLNKVQQRRWVF
ncbi:unnamed protein product, partial [Iphiclides podalirius]